jgi:oligopeptide/dipeptide ABC transporter ATP-binding protein
VSTAPGQPLLHVRDLRTEFATKRGIVHAVNGVDLDVHPGEIVGIVGESGCGKSATIRSIVGLVRPPGRVAAGAVELDGLDLRGLHERQLRRLLGSRIGFVPQNPFGALNPVLRIERQFRNVVRAHRRSSRADAHELGLTMLRHVGIADPVRVLSGYAHELSGGMAQRTVIAMAMAMDPQLIIADEPTTGLDVTVQRAILDLIVELVAGGHRSMLLVTHDLGVVAHYCDRVVVMYAGKVVEVGDTKTVFSSPGHPYTKMLLEAIPRPGHELRTIKGTLPDLVDYPPGCPFWARCEHRDDPRCETEMPPLRELEPGHAVASFYDVRDATTAAQL